MQATRDEMTVSERFQAAMNGQPVDRLPMIEWAPWWDQTLNRWRDEGLPADWQDVETIATGLGLDPIERIHLHGIGPGAPKPAYHGAPIMQAPTHEAYEKLREVLYPEPAFNEEGVRDMAERRRRGEVIVWLVVHGFFWFPRMLFGIADHLIAFCEWPDLMHRINQDFQAYMCRHLSRVQQLCPVDFMTFAEDLSYNLGPMISRSMFDEFVGGYYGPVLDAIDRSQTKVLVDSDGLVDEVTGWFMAAGADGTLPLERQAGTDIVAIRRQHPQACLIGGYDKMIMKDGPEAMRDEFERLLPVMRTGRFIPSVDHQTPPGVSLDYYRQFVQLLQQYAVEGRPQ